MVPYVSGSMANITPHRPTAIPQRGSAQASVQTVTSFQDPVCCGSEHRRGPKVVGGLQSQCHQPSKLVLFLPVTVFTVPVLACDGVYSP